MHLLADSHKRAALDSDQVNRTCVTEAACKGQKCSEKGTEKNSPVHGSNLRIFAAALSVSSILRMLLKRQGDLRIKPYH